MTNSPVAGMNTSESQWMAKAIAEHPTVRQQYAATLVEAGQVDPASVAEGGVFMLVLLPFPAAGILILHGTADKVTKPSGSKEFYEKAGSSDKTLKLYDGHAHDLLNDIGREQVIADITEKVFDVLTVEASVASRTSFGGTAPNEVRKQIAWWRAHLAGLPLEEVVGDVVVGREIVEVRVDGSHIAAERNRDVRGARRQRCHE